MIYKFWEIQFHIELASARIKRVKYLKIRLVSKSPQTIFYRGMFKNYLFDLEYSMTSESFSVFKINMYRKGMYCMFNRLQN